MTTEEFPGECKVALEGRFFTQRNALGEFTCAFILQNGIGENHPAYYPMIVAILRAIRQGV